MHTEETIFFRGHDCVRSELEIFLIVDPKEGYGLVELRLCSGFNNSDESCNICLMKVNTDGGNIRFVLIHSFALRFSFYL